MIVYDKEQKQIVIPNGLGNVNIIINGGGDCPEPNLGALVKEITENGNYVYYPSNDGLDGYNMADIRINVPQEGGGCTLTSRTFTSNGVYHPEPEQMKTIWFTAEKPSAYDTGVKLVDNSWVEIYFRATEGGDTPTLIGCEESDWNNTAFATRWYNNYLSVKIGINEESIPYTAGDGKLHKLKFGKTVGIWFDDVKISDIAGEEWAPTNHTIYIGAMNDPSCNNEKGFWRPWVGYIGDVTVYGSLNETVGEYHFKAGDYGRWGEFKRVEDNTNLPNLGGDGMAIAQTQQYGEAPDGYNEITVNVPQYNLGTLDWTLTSPSTEVKNASDDGYDGYSQVTIRPENVIAQEKERAINDFKNKMKEITITENGTYSIDDTELLHSIAFDGNSYFDTGIVPTENIKIEACIKITNGNNSGLGGIIIGGGIGPVDLANPNSTENRGIAIGMGGGAIYGVWGAIKSWNSPYKYEGEGTTTVVLQKTNDSWGWETEKGSFGASTLYIGGYNKNGQEVEEKFLQSIVYIKIWTNKDDNSTMTLFRPKNMAQGAFGVVNSEGIETGQIENLGSGTATFVEENVKKYPNGFKRVEVNVPDLNGSYNEGYAQGKADGVNEQKSKLETINITENGTYRKEDGYNEVVVNVPDLNGSYDEGFNVGYGQGKTDGANEQKSKLETINITENGTYTKEDGYNHIEVNVPDLNGSYDEGYAQGQTDVVANARVLDVTENGVYKSRFFDSFTPTVTGVYDNGNNFYYYAELSNKIFNTKIAATIDSRLEFWHKGNSKLTNIIIGSGNDKEINSFQVRYEAVFDKNLRICIGDQYIIIKNWNDRVWHHFIISKAEGLWIDGEKKGDFSSTNTINGEFFINGIGYSTDGKRSANGAFGMIKIDDTTIVPTEDGFLNTNTRELLEAVNDGGYTFAGDLYRAINVNVKPKINVKEAGIKLSDSTFTEVPEWADFNGITDMKLMFSSCKNLQTIPLIDTSNATNMNFTFAECTNLQTIPLINTNSVTNMDNMFDSCSNLQTIPQLNTSNVTSMFAMFMYCNNLQTIPQIDTSNVTTMAYMFYMSSNQENHLTSLPKFNCQNVTQMGNYFTSIKDGMSSLTDVGGWENLKCNWNDKYGLATCPNLTHQSCINILNGLYDFVGNGSTETRTLRVHPNFLTTVGDEISIGRNKGWTITAE